MTKVFVVRSESSLDHEGSPDVHSIWTDAEGADHAVEVLERDRDSRLRTDGWAKYESYHVESWPLDQIPER